MSVDSFVAKPPMPPTMHWPNWLCLHPHEALIKSADVMCLPQARKLQVATQVSQLLALHPETMLQFKPEDLVEKFMNIGDAVVIWDNNADKLIGFAKNFPWPGVNEFGHQVYEFGSWAVAPEYEGNGFGYHLAILALNSAKAKDPKAQLVAVCSVDNPKAITMLKRLGAKEAPKPQNLQILLGEGKAAVQIIDMTNLKYNL